MKQKRPTTNLYRITVGYFFLIGVAFYGCDLNGERNVQGNEIANASWMLGPFTKHEGVYPLIKSDTATFTCPVSKEKVRWRETYVFNPAAIVKDDKVYLLFRGEDKVGIHGGTSRIGIAESTDGYNFKVYPDPVLYPDNDPFLEFEKYGGVEDPRIVER